MKECSVEGNMFCINGLVAETKGFEPSRPFRAYSLSRGSKAYCQHLPRYHTQRNNIKYLNWSNLLVNKGVSSHVFGTKRRLEW